MAKPRKKYKASPDAHKPTITWRPGELARFRAFCDARAAGMGPMLRLAAVEKMDREEGKA